MSSESYLSIGEVVRRLQSTYPDLSVSKVRFLEDKGLISPDRSTGGYRKFSARDVKRLESILSMQKMYFYPLTVIKNKLDAEDRGERSPELADDAGEAAITATQLLAGQPQALTAAASMVDVPIAFIRELAQYGLVEIAKGENGPVIDGGELDLIKACWALKEQGIDPRHLRPFATAADREATLLVQAVLPQLKGATPEVQKQGLERLRELETLSAAVKRSLFNTALDSELDGLVDS